MPLSQVEKRARKMDLVALAEAHSPTVEELWKFPSGVFGLQQLLPEFRYHERHHDGCDSPLAANDRLE